MKENEFLDAVSQMDTDVVERFIRMDQKLHKKKDRAKPRRFWLRAGIIAACFTLSVGVIFGSGILDFGTVAPDVEPDDKVNGVLSLDHLLDLHNFDHIVFGDNVNSNPDQSDTEHPGAEDSNPPSQNGSWVEWHGIKVSKSLYTGLSTLEGETLIAITAKSLTPVGGSLSEYVYHGKTYEQMRLELEAAAKKRFYLEMMKDFTNHYDDHHAEFTEQDLDMFWKKVYCNVDKEFLHENGYVTDDEYPFDRTAISDDLNQYTTLCLQLEGDMADCVREYRAQSAPVINWNRLADTGFDVYKSEGTYIVVVSIDAMESFANCVKEVCTLHVITDTVFRYATYAELGLETPDIPCDDEFDNPDLSHEEIPLPDDDALDE